ncbi:MAG: efflux RND transporter periplasmic adaptor subunit [Cyanobacteria bacterium P01_H01_bin.121]
MQKPVSQPSSQSAAVNGEYSSDSLQNGLNSLASTSRPPAWRSPRIILLAAGLIVAGAGWFGFRQLQAPPSPEATAPANEISNTQTVTELIVATQPVQQRLEATGTVIAADLLPILPKAPGLQIQSVLVDEGDSVVAGQLLATLDPSVLQAQIQQQEAEITAARAGVAQQEAALEQAKANLAEAESNLQRFEDLAEQGAVSEQERDTRRTTFQTAQESVRLGAANIQSAEANVQSRIARLDQLKIQLEQTQVRAPAGGIIAERFARVGNVTSSSQSLFSLIRDRQLELEVEVPETQLGQLQPGTPVTVTSDSDPSLNITGQLDLIAPLVDPETRQAKLKIALPVSDQLRPGMFLRATFVVATRLGVAVPTDAIVPQPDGSNVVYRLDPENQAIAQAVVLGEVIDTNDSFLSEPALGATALIEVQEGLSAGDRIVVAGARYVKDGDIVQVSQ